MMHAPPIYGYNTVVPAEPLSTSEQQTPVRTNFNTPEGIYKQSMTVNEYFRANRMPSQVAGPVCNAPVRVSFLRIPIRKLSIAEEALPSTSSNNAANDGGGTGFYDAFNPIGHHGIDSYIERICFNIGREIYVFDYSGMMTDGATASPDSAKPVDKRVYKGTFPTCHDFNREGASLHSCLLLIGFSAGQIQLIDPSQKEAQNSSKLFNEERQIDRSAVTCLRWVPETRMQFVASHASGNLYLYNEEFESPQLAPAYQVLKQGEEFTVFTSKTKLARNPVNRWQIGAGGGGCAINMFEFAGPGATFMATVSQDGLLRVFNWRSMELIGCMKSYFGGLLCLAWSPDLRYIATGGEDDMLSLYSLAENRVVCRGQGHKSWVSAVAFDTFATFVAAATSPSDQQEMANASTDEILLASSSSEFMVPINSANALSSSTTMRPNQNNNMEAIGQKSLHQNVVGGGHSHFYAQMEQQPNGYLSGGGGSKNASKQQQSIGQQNNNNVAILGHQNSSGPTNLNNAPRLPHALSAQSTGSMCLAATVGNGGIGGMNGGGEFGGTQSRLIYRLGTVGHDCQLCLWDISEDVLLSGSLAPTPASFSRNSRIIGPSGGGRDGPLQIDASPSPIGFLAPSSASPFEHSAQQNQQQQQRNTTVIPIGIDNAICMPQPPSISMMPSSKHANSEQGSDTMKSTSDKDGGGTSKGSRFKRLHKRGLSLGSRLTDRSNRQNGASSNGPHSVDGTLKRGDRLSTQLFGTPQCPRIEEIPVIEPLICKKVANERLGSLHFREDCIVTACQEGYICTWARPNSHNRQDGRPTNLSLSDGPNDYYHPQQQNQMMMSADNFASTCV